MQEVGSSLTLLKQARNHKSMCRRQIHVEQACTAGCDVCASGVMHADAQDDFSKLPSRQFTGKSCKIIEVRFAGLTLASMKCSCWKKQHSRSFCHGVIAHSTFLQLWCMQQSKCSTPWVILFGCHQAVYFVEGDHQMICWTTIFGRKTWYGLWKGIDL